MYLEIANGTVDVTNPYPRLRADVAEPIRPLGDARSPEFRAVLYSHDTMGLGHLRRNQLVAMAIRQAIPESRVLLVAGTQQATCLQLPPGIDSLTLPSLAKSSDGLYSARSLGLPLAEVTAIRQASIRAAVESFDPDLFIADKAPRGACGELDAALDWLARRGRAHRVCGLRDVLDEPQAVQRDWRLGGCERAIDALYDEVWVYGDKRVYDLAAEYRWPEIVANKLRYLGYLDQQFRLTPDADEESQLTNDLRLGDIVPGDGRLLVCAVGGGQDGALLAAAFAAAPIPSGHVAVLLTGPFFPADKRRALHHAAADNPQLRVVDFLPEADRLIRRADRLVTMGGYNSVCAALSFCKPTLVVPRTVPRREQWIRAERLAARKLVDLLSPTQASPAAIAAWLARPAASFDPRGDLDMQGFQRVGAAVRPLLSRTSQVEHA